MDEVDAQVVFSRKKLQERGSSMFMSHRSETTI